MNQRRPKLYYSLCELNQKSPTNTYVEDVGCPLLVLPLVRLRRIQNTIRGLHTSISVQNGEGKG